MSATEVAARPRHARGPSWPVAVLRTARPRQWPKNLLVFAAPLAAPTLGRRDWLVYAFAAAAAFGFASVAVYFINDVADAERDRSHRVSGTGRWRPATCPSGMRSCWVRRLPWSACWSAC